MRNWFVLNGVDSRDFGVYISGQGTFSAPRREYNMIPIPGRNGDLVGNEKRFENLELTYPAFIYTNFKQNIRDFRNFLLSLVGYHTLTDSYHTDEFRMALYEGEFEPEVQPRNDAGQFDIVFNCKPQRFLNSGTEVTTLTASGSITNPTRFASQPLLRVYGSGQLGINSDTITISRADVYTDIDCAMMDCFKGTTNRNQFVSFSSYNFPVLQAGENNFSLGSGISRVEITPRWWRL
jgi:phage-related protein